MQVVANGTARIRSYDLASGDLVWQCGRHDRQPNSLAGSVRRLRHLHERLQRLGRHLDPLSAKGDLGETGKVNWRHTGGTPYVPSPVLVGDTLVFTQANESLLTTLDAKTGKVILDKERLPQVKSFFASPITAAGGSTSSIRAERPSS